MRQKIRQFGPILMVLFYIYVFPKINEFIAPYIQTFIEYLGIYGPLGYIAIGLGVTVFAPLGLGPLNITLHQAFGFIPSLIYFFTYSFIGLMINFTLSKIFGKSIVHFFFPDMKAGNDMPSLQGIKYTYKKFEDGMKAGNFRSFIIFLGGGNELLSYLAGTTKLSYIKFFIICLASSIINSLLFVTRNIFFQRNDFIFFGLEALFYLLSIVSLIAIFYDDFGKVKKFYEKINYIGKDYKSKLNTLKKDEKYNENKKKLVEEKNQKFNSLFNLKK